jgi:acetyl esterase/lipase
LIVTADDDPLRDEASAYAQRLRDASVVVSSTRLPSPTGWPCSLMSETAGEAEIEPAWAGALRQQFSSFLAALQAAS